MVFVRTTPSRPLQVGAVFPELAPLARPAIRLHPRPGSPSVGDSSVGGPLLWPAGEPWPHCEDVHLHVDTGFRESLTEVRLQRGLQSRWRPDERPPAYTPEEEALRERAAARLAERLDSGLAWPAECPVPLLPVAQLFLRDVPLLRPPGRADLLQVLWCPYEHEPDCKPSAVLVWRSAAEVGDILAAPPEPYEADYPGYVPEPCVLAPEAITDYPNSLDLSPELQRLLEDWSRWQAAGSGVDSSYARYPREFYSLHLGNAPGWKVGGWPPWGRTDPIRRYCAVCEVQMVPLLTIASFEWDGGEGRSWAPQEEQDAVLAGSRGPRQYLSQPTRVEVGSTDNLQIYVCPTSPEHPHTDLIQ
ncbi:hypothetical protein DEJ48_07055 [Streptomyces venezuelae]|uniref:DUF1963 domain-containing protein n=1 Tax=Streptomyces venezuelae TaxID=54571 RepID=A0A5P2BTB2_STRVZ|nr:hypothetical protein DEJ48_07055 [Streptomyces venezuelae]